MSELRTRYANVTASIRKAGILERLAGRNLLFSEERQAIYELDDMSAYVWCATSRGLNPASIVREMVSEGIDRDVAEDTLSECLKRLKRMMLA